MSIQAKYYSDHAYNRAGSSATVELLVLTVNCREAIWSLSKYFIKNVIPIVGWFTKLLCE